MKVGYYQPRLRPPGALKGGLVKEPANGSLVVLTSTDRQDTAAVEPHIDNLRLWVHIVDGNINLFPDLFVVNVLL